jgi:hypothetical protein
MPTAQIGKIGPVGIRGVDDMTVSSVNRGWLLAAGLCYWLPGAVAVRN